MNVVFYEYTPQYNEFRRVPCARRWTELTLAPLLMPDRHIILNGKSYETRELTVTIDDDRFTGGEVIYWIRVTGNLTEKSAAEHVQRLRALL